MLGVALQASGNILGADVVAGMCAWIIKGLIFLIGFVLLNISPSFVFSVWLIEKGAAPDAGCCWHREKSAHLSRNHPEILGGFFSQPSQNTRRIFVVWTRKTRRISLAIIQKYSANISLDQSESSANFCLKYSANFLAWARESSANISRNHPEILGEFLSQPSNNTR